MNNNYNNYGYLGGIQPGGYSYNQNVNPPKPKQTLTKEQIEMLRKNTDTFSLGLTQEELLRGICLHRDVNGMETLKPNADGTVTCTICGKTFDPVQDMNEEDARATTQDFIDIIQTIKLLYLDMPVEVAEEFFQIIPLAEKVPKLYKLAADNFAKHENYNNWRYSGSPNTVNLYNMLMGGGNVGMYGQQQMYPQGQPMYGQTTLPTAPYGTYPNQMPMTGQALMPGSNGMGYMGAPIGYQPQTTGFQYNAPVGSAPVPPQPQMQPQTQVTTNPTPQPSNNGGNVAPTNATAGKDVKVDATFKA